MTSAAGVQYVIGKLRLSRFQQCVHGTAAAEQKKFIHTSVSHKCTVPGSACNSHGNSVPPQGNIMRYRALGRFCEYLGRVAYPPNFVGRPMGPVGGYVVSFVTGRRDLEYYVA